MLVNTSSVAKTRQPPRDERRLNAKSVFLTWRAKESIQLTDAIAAELEIELEQFAKDLRALN